MQFVRRTPIFMRHVFFLAAIAVLVVPGLPAAADAQRQAFTPANASPSDDGASWSCNDGFVRRDTKCVPVRQATDAEIRQHLIDLSIATYRGRCPCPYFTDRAGRRCGGRSAYSRPGGYSPKCYAGDVSAEEVRAFRDSAAKHAGDVPTG